MLRQELAFVAPGSAVWLDQELPKTVSDHEILVENTVTLCSAGSADLAAFRGELPARASWPYRPGGGAAGRVTSVGRSVTRFAVGDRVCTAASNETHSVIDLRKSLVASLPPSASLDAGVFAFILSGCLQVVRSALRLGDGPVAVVGSGPKAVLLAACADQRGVDVHQHWIAPRPLASAQERRQVGGSFDAVFLASAAAPAVREALRKVSAGGNLFLAEGSAVPVDDLRRDAALRGATVVDVSDAFSTQNRSPNGLSDGAPFLAEAVKLLSRAVGGVAAPVSHRCMAGSAPMIYPMIESDLLAFTGVIIVLSNR